MKKELIPRLITLLLCLFSLIRAEAQYTSLKEAPMFKSHRVNLFIDTASQRSYSIETMDSLYKAGNSPFQILGSNGKGDTVTWRIFFIQEIPSIRHKWLHQKFPAQDLVDIRGDKITQEDRKGKTLIINCWSVGCAPCLAEMPYLNRLADSLDKKKFLCLGITFDSTADIERLFKSQKLKDYLNLEDVNFHFTIIPAQGGFLDHILAIKNYPTTFIVDKQGVIQEIIEGVNLDNHQQPTVFSEISHAIDRLVK